MKLLPKTADPLVIRANSESQPAWDKACQRGRSFRALPAEIPTIQNNLSIAKMGFAEFADGVDEGCFPRVPRTLIQAVLNQRDHLPTRER